MDLLHSSPAFIRKILDVCGQPEDMNVVGIRRSVSDTTDIELVASNSNVSCGFLIENKVRAPLMDRQFARYRMRGEAGAKAGQWSRFKVILMSPRSYFQALGPEHSDHLALLQSVSLDSKTIAAEPVHKVASKFASPKNSCVVEARLTGIA